MADEDADRPIGLLRMFDDATVRSRWLWSVNIGGLITGLVAVLATGVLRRLGAILLEICFLLAVFVLSRYPPGQASTIDDELVHKSPRHRILVFLQGALLLLYNAGIMLVVLALLIRFDAVNYRFSGGAQAWFPLGLAVYLTVLIGVARMRIEDDGIGPTTWYSRTSMFTTIILGAAVLILGTFMLFVPEFQVLGFLVTADDLMLLVLIVALNAATLLFFIAGIPTVYDIVLQAFSSRKEGDAPPVQTPPIVYAGLVALGAVAIIGFIVDRLQIIDRVGQALSSEQGAWILILLPVGLAAFSLYTALRLYSDGRQGLYRKKIPTKLRNDLMVYGFSTSAGMTLAVITGMILTGRLESIGPFKASIDVAKDLIMLTLLVTVGPIGVYMNRQARRIDNIEARLPDFLNDLAETRRAGLTLTNSLHTAARSDYGPLTAEVHKMSNQVGWGVPFTDALRQFSERVKSSLVERSTNLIIEASKTGGSVAAILKAAADDAREIKGLESERKSVLLTYLVVIYVTFFVFLAVVAVLDGQFIPQVLLAQEKLQSADVSGVGAFSSITGNALDAEALRFTYFNAGVVQAIGNGTIGGLLVEQRVTAGFRHVAIMVVASWIVFRLALGL